MHATTPSLLRTSEPQRPLLQRSPAPTLQLVPPAEQSGVLVFLLRVSGVAELSRSDPEVDDDGEGDDVRVELLPVQLVDAHGAGFLREQTEMSLDGVESCRSINV